MSNASFESNLRTSITSLFNLMEKMGLLDKEIEEAYEEYTKTNVTNGAIKRNETT